YADSTPGEGSRFTVLLPRLEDSNEVDGDTSPHAAPQGGTETILLVEDDPRVRSVVRCQLERQGYTVRDAPNGVEAIRIATAPEERIDLVLTDVVMPELSGRALAEQLAASRPELRVVYMSGYTDDEILRRGLLQPGTTYIEKPFTLARLADALRQALDGPRPTRTA
ncbi:MAG TPA: response regulator, partial [Gemmatimonadaceae bacterium]|nr:response regulator [Gemmatimonadaceae bacterium]